MFDIDRWQEIATTLGRNKLRTLLTALGVFWGIFMLVVMLGFGSSLENGVKKNMLGFTTNAVFMVGRETSLPYAGLPAGRSIEFRNDDVAAVAAAVPEIEHISPRVRMGGWRGATAVRRGAITGSYNITGVLNDFLEIQPMNIDRGRFINDFDERDRRKVAVIGSEVYKQLFLDANDPVGESIEVLGVHFQIVGTFTTLSGGHLGDRLANTVFLPLSTFQQAYNYDDRIDSIAITAAANASAVEVENRARAVLRERHHVSPDDAQAIRGWNFGEEFQKLQSLFSGINAVIWFVGIFTLLAGVIGVSNIMLIAVKERTKEFGVRKAIGARPSSIIAMVLQESVVLTSIAGYVGLVAGVGLIEIASHFLASSPASGPSPETAGAMLAAPTISINAAAIATGVLVIAGALAGVIPARHAARIEPVAALRAE